MPCFSMFFTVRPVGATAPRHDILDRMSLAVPPAALVDCSAFVTKISDAPRVRQAIKEAVFAVFFSVFFGNRKREGESDQFTLVVGSPIFWGSKS